MSFTTDFDSFFRQFLSCFWFSVSLVYGKETINAIIQHVPPVVFLLNHASASLNPPTPPDSNHLVFPNVLDVLAEVCKIQLGSSDLRHQKRGRKKQEKTSSPSSPLILLQDETSS